MRQPKVDLEAAALLSVRRKAVVTQMPSCLCSSKTRFGCRAHALASWTAAAWGRGAAGPTATARLRAVAKSTATPAPATSISSSTPHEAPQLAAGSGPPSPAASGPALPHDLLLSDVRVVLVAPKHEANIGAVARAAANFE